MDCDLIRSTTSFFRLDSVSSRRIGDSYANVIDLISNGLRPAGISNSPKADSKQTTSLDRLRQCPDIALAHSCSTPIYRKCETS